MREETVWRDGEGESVWMDGWVFGVFVCGCLGVFVGGWVWCVCERETETERERVRDRMRDRARDRAR